MKDVLLAFSIIWCSQTATANCSPWALFGGALPSRVDGHSANYREMLVAQQRTRDYINEVEQTIAHCKPDNHTHDSLVKSMELAAERYNRSLAAYLESERSRVAQTE